MLRLILAGHSRLHIPPETWYLLDLVRELPLTAVLDPVQVERAVTIMTDEYRWPDLDMPADELCREAAALQEPRLVDVVNLVYHRQLRTSGKPRFGDKTPIYFTIIPQLVALYPEARFIHLIRDGRDVAISWIDLNYDRYYEPKFEWTMAMAKRKEFIAGPYADRILEVRYEDLARDLESTVRRICAFLDEEFEPGMLSWSSLQTLIPERERHIHRKIGQPISPDVVAVWQRKLSAFECFAMEACMWRELRQLGYQLKFSAAVWRPLLMGAGSLLLFTGPLLGRTVRHLRRRGYLKKQMYI